MSLAKPHPIKYGEKGVLHSEEKDKGENDLDDRRRMDTSFIHKLLLSKYILRICY